MMFVRIVWVRMTQRRVRMGMRVRFGACLRNMIMLMVRIVDMLMIVGQRRMRVLMLVMLGEVQPKADHHQDRGQKQLNRDRLARNTSHAIRMEKTPSRFSNSDALDAAVALSPYIMRTGATMPPALIAAASHQRSAPRPASSARGPRRK